MTEWLAASDGSYDHRLGLGAWGVALCRGARRDGSPHGLQSRSGRVPAAAALSPHACEAFAVLRALRWIRKLGGRACVLASDCAGLAALLGGEATADVPPDLPGALAEAAAGLRWSLVAPEAATGTGAEVLRPLHQRCHRAALGALRQQRDGPRRSPP